MKKILQFCKKEAVLCIACLLAFFSMFLVPPDAEYVHYIDFRTLSILFCLMAVMAGLQQLGAFRKLAQMLLSKVHSMFRLVLILVMLCFFSSMLITNDVALITFVPFTFIVLRLTGEENVKKYAVPVVVMQTIAANLGSMLTPIGNPQNLYLYGISEMPLLDFILLMLPYTIVSCAALIVWIFLQTKQAHGSLSVSFGTKGTSIQKKRLLLYIGLFLLCIMTVARVIHDLLLLGIVLAVLLLADRKALRNVDYSLLLTFTGFFVFIGNAGRIPVFRDFLESMISGRETVTAILASQAISNVPAALLLSGFTENTEALIIGTNLGGLGTLIASMASLITFKYVSRELCGEKGRFMKVFTISNLLFLALLFSVLMLIS